MKSDNSMVGFRIRADIKRPSTQLVGQVSQYQTPALADGMRAFNIMDQEIKPIVEPCHIVGPAVTLRLRPGDNLMLHKCLGMLQPGDVLVVDTCGCRTRSVLGELIATAVFQAGAAGVVVDGGIRDLGELRKQRFPIFARFVTPSVGGKDGPGEINYPISCGGVPVHPGDLIVGDENGVAVLPLADVETIIEAAEKKLDYEKRRRQDIRDGVIFNPQIDIQLKEKGVIL